MQYKSTKTGIWHKIDYFVGTYQCAGLLINSAVISFIVLLSEKACNTWRVLHAVRTEHSVLQVPLGRKYGSWPAWMSKPSDERLGCGLSSLWIWSGDLKTIPKKIIQALTFKNFGLSIYVSLKVHIINNCRWSICVSVPHPFQKHSFCYRESC